LKVSFDDSQRGAKAGSLGDSHTWRGLGPSSVGHPTVVEVLVELGNDVAAVGEVTVAASTSCLAFSCELTLETDFVARRVLGGDIVSRPSPASLQVSNGLVALGESSLPASQETTVGVGVLPLVLGDREHATATSSTSATTDARDFNDRPQLSHLSLDNFLLEVQLVQLVFHKEQVCACGQLEV